MGLKPTVQGWMREGCSMRIASNMGSDTEVYTPRKLTDPHDFLAYDTLTTAPPNRMCFPAQIADASKFLQEGETDADFCKRLTTEAGVTLIPTSGFYVAPDPPRTLVRFAFCKSDDKLHSALKRLESYFSSLQHAQ